MKKLILCVLTAVLPILGRGENQDYAGLPELRHLASSLFEAAKGIGTSGEMVHLDPSLTPSIRTSQSANGTTITVSQGLLDLINEVSHANAINKVQPGFLPAFCRALGGEEKSELHKLIDVTRSAFWSEQVLNEQRSNFNQIGGMLIAMELAYVQNGHYKKFQSEVGDHPIPTLLASAEWERSVTQAVKIALDCGFGTEGILGLFECIEQMPARGAWTFYLYPPQGNLPRLKKRLVKLEKDFFSGKIN